MDPIAWLEKKVYGFSDLADGDLRAINHFALLWALFEQRVLNTEDSAGAIVEATAAMAKDGRLVLDGLLTPTPIFVVDTFVTTISPTTTPGLGCEENLIARRWYGRC